MKNIVLFFLFTSLCHVVLGQGEIDTQEKVLFQNERSISLSLNTNGFGAGYRFGKRKTYLTKTLYDIDLAYIKHPKEVRIAPGNYGYTTTSRRYVPGKMNIFVNFGPSIGYQREIFSKEDKGSIAVRYFYGIGPSIGITKPVYYTFAIGDANGNFKDFVDEKYDYAQHSISSVAGRASFWKGFDELHIYPGLHAKGGFSFEYSSFNKVVNALEVSAILDAFNKKIPIMLTKHNSQIFFTLSLSYRFGWIVDTRYKAPKITREGERQSE